MIRPRASYPSPIAEYSALAAATMPAVVAPVGARGIFILL
jgi:hypothetical protein